MPYAGNGTFGAPSAFVQSNGENNYYPSYSPGRSDAVRGLQPRRRAWARGPHARGGFCPNDSFSNPAARLMLALARVRQGRRQIDLEKANGSPASATLPLSNSYPRWAPFVQSYHGQELLWITFSSTRDYGVRVLNHKTGMYQCYPADAAETPGGAHNGKFAAQCQEPQLWMAPITFTEAQGSALSIHRASRSGSPTRTSPPTTIRRNGPSRSRSPCQTRGTPACTCSGLSGACGPANGGCPCCSGQGLVCSGNSQCIQVVN